MNSAASRRRKTSAWLATSYLAFLAAAVDRETGRFRNFMSHGRQWLEKPAARTATACALGRRHGAGVRATKATAALGAVV
jgi:hypothetical protein